jgi:hypothetical protein
VKISSQMDIGLDYGTATQGNIGGSGDIALARDLITAILGGVRDEMDPTAVLVAYGLDVFALGGAAATGAVSVRHDDRLGEG